MWLLCLIFWRWCIGEGGSRLGLEGVVRVGICWVEGGDFGVLFCRCGVFGGGEGG